MTADHQPEQPEQPHRRGPTRREVLSGAVMLGVGAGLDELLRSGGSGGGASTAQASAAVPFHGLHQAGVATSAQEYLNFAAFDLVGSSTGDLRDILKRWSLAAAELTAGRPYTGSTQATPSGAPVDTGETVGLGPAELTITIGLGPGIFAPGRFGLSGRGPSELAPLPAFHGEQLDPAQSGGDLCVQACANDPQVTFHAIHMLRRLAAPAARMRWNQLGFGRTSSTTRKQPTPRNLMGFKDGTDNIRAEDTALMDEAVWVAASDGQDWMAGGTYLIARRIRILFDVWDATSLRDQERTIGRTKLEGAPLGSRAESDPVNLSAKDPSGRLTIPNNAHIRITSPQTNEGHRILRRGYSYSEGGQTSDGQIDAGLFFIAFQRSPNRQFIPLQNRVAAFDALNRHTLHTSSAIFACPPGASEGGFVGEGLFA